MTQARRPGSLTAQATAGRGRRGVLCVGGPALYAALLVLLATRQGPGVSADSVYYYHAAASFVTEGGFNAFGMPLTLWPIGYPWLLSLTMIARLPTEATVVAVNACCAAATVALTYLLARIVTRSTACSVAACVIIAAVPATVRTYSMLWTEPLFTGLALLVLLHLAQRVRERDFRAVDVATVSILISSATLLRFAGVALVPVAVAAVLLSTERWRRPSRIALAGLVGSLSCLGLLAIAARNLSLGSPPLGARSSSGLPLVNLIGHSLRAMGRYVIPEMGGLLPLGPVPEGILGLLLMGATIALGLALWCALFVAAFVGIAGRDRLVALLVVWLMSWWALLWYGSLLAGADPPEDRLLAPVLPAMVILVVHLLNASSTRWRAAQPLRRLGTTLLILWLVSSVAAGVVAGTRAGAKGIGYNTVADRESELITSVRALPTTAAVAASDPWLVYWATRRPTYSVYDERIAALVSGGRVDYVVLVRDAALPGLPEPPTNQFGPLELVVRTPTGVVYRISR